MSQSTASSSAKTALQWWLGGALLFVFLVIGLSTLFLQKQLRESQESRSQASVPSGPVTITSTDNDIKSGATSFITLGVNTQNVQLRELQLNFDLLLPTTVTTPPTSYPQISQLMTGVTTTSSTGIIATPLPSGQIGWRISMTVNPPAPGASFSTPGTIQDLVRIELPLPVTTGQLQVVFDPVTSHAYAWAQPPALPTTDLLTITPDLNMTILPTTCAYTYGAWSACQNGSQNRSYTVQPSTCPAPNAALLTQSCLPQCTYTYSNWGSCVNGWQTRTYSQTPTNCTWYTPATLQPLTNSCAPNTTSRDFSAYTYESCWATQSAGNTSYVMWNQTVFPAVTKVEVSTTSDFANFASKDVAGATQTLGTNHLETDGTNLRTTDGQNQLWVFWPGYTYYFRLTYNNGQRSSVITYFVPKCAGTSSTAYKLCNETCSNNSECSANLACVSGQCRRADNAGSTVCATPPDKGLNRACNDYCANDGECGGGLKCWWNRCRLAKNLEDTSCRAPAVKKVTYIYQTPSYTNYVAAGTGVAEAACNQSCGSNRDCAADLRCYQGTCRLPANVTNSSCLTVAGQAAAATASATVAPTAEPTLIPLDPALTNETTNWFTSTGAWLVSRLGFLIVGLILAVIIVLVWPLLRSSVNPRTYVPTRSTTVSSTTTQVHQSISHLMAPPVSQAPQAQPTRPVVQPPVNKPLQINPNQPPRA